MVCEIVGQTLQDMQYFVKTIHGRSLHYYAHSKADPVFGTGQGSCASPAIRMALSSVLIKALTDHYTGVTMSDPAGNHEIHRVIDEFVDDTTICINDANEELSPEELTMKLRDIAQSWEKLLFASGGALELKKCFYYCLIWNWNGEGEPSYTTAESMDNQIHITQGHSTIFVPIEQRDCAEPHRTLGYHGNPLGHQTAEFQHLLTKSTKIATIMCMNSLDPFETMSVYFSL